MSNFDDEFNFAVSCVKQVGEIISRAFRSSKRVTEKSCFNDLVTETDKEVEETLIKLLRTKFPEYKFIGEESASDDGHCELTDSRTWIIDPIDGTTNFVHQNPNICTILAFVENKDVKFGIVYNPITQELWSAKKGRGAFYNGEKISVSDCRELKKSLLIQEFYGSNEAKNEMMQSNMKSLITKVSSYRCYGSAGIDLVYLAMGRCDLFFDSGLHVWDFAGPALIITEAGGVVSNIRGGSLDLMSRNCLAAASQDLVDQLLPLIVSVDMGRD